MQNAAAAFMMAGKGLIVGFQKMTAAAAAAGFTPPSGVKVGDTAICFTADSSGNLTFGGTTGWFGGFRRQWRSGNYWCIGNKDHLEAQDLDGMSIAGAFYDVEIIYLRLPPAAVAHSIDYYPTTAGVYDSDGRLDHPGHTKNATACAFITGMAIRTSPDLLLDPHVSAPFIRAGVVEGATANFGHAIAACRASDYTSGLDVVWDNLPLQDAAMWVMQYYVP